MRIINDENFYATIKMSSIVDCVGMV